MGNKDRKRQKKMKGSKKPASNKSKTTASSTSNRTESDIDEKKGSQQSIEEIRGASNFPQTGTERKDKEECRNNTDAVQTSSTKVFVMFDRHIEEIFRIYVKALKSENPELFENLITRYILKAKIKNRWFLSYIDRNSKILSQKEINHAQGNLLHNTAIEMYEEFVMMNAKLNNCKEITKDSGEIGVKNVGTNVDDGPVDDNQEARHSTKILTEDKVYSQESELNLNTEEFNDEELIKTTDCSDELMGRSRDVSKMIHKTETLRQNEFKASSFQETQRLMKKYPSLQRSKSNKDLEKSMNLKSTLNFTEGTRNARFSQQEIKDQSAKAFEEIEASKAKAEEINDIIAINKIEDDIKALLTSLEVDAESQLISTEDTMRENKGKEDREISDKDSQDFYSLKERKCCTRKDNEDKIKNILPVCDFQRDLKEFMKMQNSNLDEQVKKYRELEKDIETSNKDSQDFYSLKEIKCCNRKDNEDLNKNNLPVRDFQRDLKEFMKMQNSNLDEQVKKYRESEEVIAKEQPDLFHSEKERLASVTMTELQKEFRVATKNEDCRIEGVAKTAERDDQPNERVTQQLNSEKEKLRFAQKVEDCKRKDNEDKTICEKAKVMSGSDFKRDYKKSITKLESAKLDDQEKKIRKKELEKIVTNEQRDLFSSEKDQSAAVAMTGLHEETKVKTSNKDGKIEKVMKSAEEDKKPGEKVMKSAQQDKEPDEKVMKSGQLDDEQNEIIELEKDCDIRFELLSNGYKRIFVGGLRCYKLSEKQRITFKYKDECAQVSFAGNQIFLFTPISEFDVFVRKSFPIDLANVSTQTDSL